MSEHKKVSATLSAASKKTGCLTMTHQWLNNRVASVPEHKYRHRMLKEELEYRDAMIQELVIYAHQAHEDFRQAIRDLLGDSLSPLDEPNLRYPLDEYPRRWPLTTLKGYFGELFAGIIAEQFHPFDEKWEIPAFLFRLHLSEFHQLEMLGQTGEEPKTRPGRFGDDFLAFQRNDAGRIVKALVCEAKCTYKHDHSQIHEAHTKASQPNLVPVDYLNVIGILQKYEDSDPSAREWIEALRQLQFIRPEAKELNYSRYDLISYICGLPPKKNSTEIMPRHQPHSNYKGGRWLEAVEVELFDVEGLVEAVYQKEIILSCSLTDVELEDAWQKIVAHINEPSFKALIEQHCRLVTYDRKKACISVTSHPLFRQVLLKRSQVEDAFEKSGLFIPTDNQGKISIRLRCIKSQ